MVEVGACQTERSTLTRECDPCMRAEAFMALVAPPSHALSLWAVAPYEFTG
jgi:hypothetical protein